MGTRHLTCVIQDGEFRVAQYGQWDGYPKGQGRAILDFLKMANLHHFRSRVRKRCRFFDNKEFKERYKALGLPENLVMNAGETEVYHGAFPYLNRDLGAAILEEIYHSTDIVELRDDSAFAHDSLMCEWAYVLDLDHNVLEVYRGHSKNFNTPKGAFANGFGGHRDDEYATVTLIQTYQLDDLPSVETLVEQCDPAIPEV